MGIVSALAKKTLREAAKHIDDLKGIDPITKKALTVEKKEGRKQTEAAIKGTATNRSTTRKSAATGAAGGAGLASASSKDKSESTRDKNTANSMSNKKKDPYSGGVDAITTAALAKLNKSDDAKEMSFSEAFKEARKEGQKEFTWRGDKYSTETKKEQIAKEKMYKGGYKTKKANMGMLNGKKPRTGTMDYRKGGLFK